MRAAIVVRSRVLPVAAEVRVRVLWVVDSNEGETPTTPTSSSESARLRRAFSRPALFVSLLCRLPHPCIRKNSFKMSIHGERIGKYGLQFEDS